LSALLAD
jgi:hypothetical protein